MTREEAKKILERIVNTSNELTHPVILNTEMGAIKVAIKALQVQKTGKWLEKNRVYSEESHIEDWQSCRCSVCGHYDTRPYMYYFDEPNYCSYCGARMVGDEE